MGLLPQQPVAPDGITVADLVSRGRYPHQGLFSRASAQDDAAVAWAGASGAFELNTAIPVMARNVLESVRILSTSSTLFAERCIDGIEPDVDRMRRLAESSPSIVTPLNSAIGYEEAAKVAKEALKEKKTIRQTVIDRGLIGAAELAERQLRRIARPTGGDIA